MDKITVFIADDNRELVHIMQEYLNGQDDLEVIGVAYDGKECLQLLDEMEPDVLLLDIIMPHLDGLAVLQQVREQDRKRYPNIIIDRKSTRLNSSHVAISYAVFCLKKKIKHLNQ